MTVYATLVTINISTFSSPSMTCERTLNHGRVARVSQNLGARLAICGPNDNTASAGQDRLTFVATNLQIQIHITASAKELHREA